MQGCRFKPRLPSKKYTGKITFMVIPVSLTQLIETMHNIYKFEVQTSDTPLFNIDI